MASLSSPAKRSGPPAATIREFLSYVMPSLVASGSLPSWPPDAFAIAAALLHKSGAYSLVLRQWPPKPLRIAAGERPKPLRIAAGERPDVTKRITGYANRSLEFGRADSGSTLCNQMHPSRLRVLPELHVPQSGLTVRSLSRNLALCTGEEIRPQWINIPSPTSPTNPGSFNLLLLPWPRIQATRH